MFHFNFESNFSVMFSVSFQWGFFLTYPNLVPFSLCVSEGEGNRTDLYDDDDVET